MPRGPTTDASLSALNLRRNFRMVVQSRFGRLAGCTHLNEVLAAVPDRRDPGDGGREGRQRGRRLKAVPARSVPCAGHARRDGAALLSALVPARGGTLGRDAMKIHEYQAKELLRKYGVPTPRGVPCFSVDEAVQAAKTLGGPVWVVKAQIHAGGRGKGGGVKLARSVDEAKTLAGQILGMQLVTHQTGPQGQKVRRLLIEEGADIKKELLPRHGRRPRDAEGRADGLGRGRHGHRGSRRDAPGEDPPPRRRSRDRDQGRRGRRRRAQDRDPRGERAAGARGAAGALPCVLGNGLVARRDQPADPHRRRPRDRARRQDELRRQRALPPSRDSRDARPRRGGPGRGRGVEVRPQLHPARRQHRLPGERRRARDGDDGHRSSSTAGRRRTSSTSAAARRPRR